MQLKKHNMHQAYKHKNPRLQVLYNRCNLQLSSLLTCSSLPHCTGTNSSLPGQFGQQSILGLTAIRPHHRAITSSNHHPKAYSCLHALQCVHAVTVHCSFLPVLPNLCSQPMCLWPRKKAAQKLNPIYITTMQLCNAVHCSALVLCPFVPALMVIEEWEIPWL